jgi:hypothetical protein
VVSTQSTTRYEWMFFFFFFFFDSINFWIRALWVTGILSDRKSNPDHLFPIFRNPSKIDYMSASPAIAGKWRISRDKKRKTSRWTVVHGIEPVLWPDKNN